MIEIVVDIGWKFILRHFLPAPVKFAISFSRDSHIGCGFQKTQQQVLIPK